MKKMINGLFALPVALASLNAHALVREFKMDCSLTEIQANAPAFSLDCSIIQSFGPSRTTCSAYESWYFPSAGNKTIELEYQTGSFLEGFNYRGGAGDTEITAKVRLSDSTGTIRMGGLEYSCSAALPQ